MVTRLTAAIAALLAAVASVWWLVQPDDARSLGEVTVLVVAQPPAGRGDGVRSDANGADYASTVANPCTGLTAALAPATGVEWSSATQGNGLRACRWSRTWRLSDLAAHPLPGEPRVDVTGGTVTVTIDPLTPEQGSGVTTLEVTVRFPGEVLSRSGSAPLAGTTVEWTNPAGFFSGTGLSAAGRAHPLLLSILPWAALGLALLGLVAAVPWIRLRRPPSAVDPRGPAEEDEPVAPRHAPSKSLSASADRRGEPSQATAAARPAGPDPASPWRPPSPH